MNSSGRFSRRSFTVIFLFMALVLALVNAALYWGLQQLVPALSAGGTGMLRLPMLHMEIPVTSLDQVAGYLKLMQTAYTAWVLPATAGLFLFFTLVLWLLLKVSMIGVFKGEGAGAAVSDGVAPEQKEKDFADQRMEQERKRRMFLHMLSVLQREGRLLDFFGEDLSLYEDDQIGAAVRSIHEECKAAVDKYIAPVPVMDQEEGETVDILPGFDPDAVKLTGNVAGDPPFKGILRHRGWKAGKKEIPRLADVMDPDIIVPAEVEIE